MIRPLSVDGGAFYAASNCYGSNTGSVFRSVDYGSTWTRISAAFVGTRVQAVASVGNTVFAGTYDSGVYRSDNGGVWKPTPADREIAARVG